MAYVADKDERAGEDSPMIVEDRWLSSCATIWSARFTGRTPR